jgi:Fe-S cluster assembly protein SufD
MSIQLSTPVNRQAAEALSRSKGEPEWLTAKRAEAAELVETLELPKVEKTRIDRWNLSVYGQYKAAQPVNSAAELSQDIQAYVTESQAGLLVTRKALFLQTSKQQLVSMAQSYSSTCIRL